MTLESNTSVQVREATTGPNIATREAAELDGSANTRHIQVVDTASRQFVPEANRGSTPVTVADGVDLTNLSADLTDNVLDVGDNSVLVVHPEHSAVDGDVVVTPLVFDSTGTTVIAVLESKSSGIGSVAFRKGSSSGNYLSPTLVWKTQGTEKIALHISSIAGTSNGVTLNAGLI
jgi:hypothetical protein